MNRILPTILATLTQCNRQKVVAGVDFDWSGGSFVHNLFRLYELIFWRREGIRAEMTTIVENDQKIVLLHSWESVFVFAESYVRSFLRELAYARIYIPVVTTPQNIPLFASPYIFAIAFGAFTDGTTTTSFSVSVSGSNTLLMAVDRNGLTDTATSATYNSVSMTQDNKIQIPTDRWAYMFSLINPTTGSNTLAFTGGANRTIAWSYTGVNQTGQPEAKNTNTAVASTSVSVAVTTVTNNAWLIGWGDSSGGTNSAGTNTTSRGNSAGTMAIDTNAPQTPAGSFSMQMTDTISAGLAIMADAFAPTASAVIASPLSLLTLLGVG